MDAETSLPISPDTLHVVAAVIRRGREVLIAQRPLEKHQGGLWEFPGGKKEANELPVEALRRELREELDIEIHSADPLIQVLHDYGDRRVLLDVFSVTAFRGEPHGLEGQPVLWVANIGLKDFSFPEANWPILKAACLPSRYVISPLASELAPTRWLDAIAAIMVNDAAGMLPLLQLRFTDCSFAENLAVAEHIRQRWPQARVLLNSALLMGESDGDQVKACLQEQRVDGVHFSARHYADERFREAIMRHRPGLCGVSCHDARELLAADDADFATLSPVLPTQSHPGVNTLGWTAFAHMTRVARLPVFALGGVGPEHLETACKAGAQGIAGIRGWISL